MRSFACSIIILVCSACELAVDVDVPREPTKATLNSLFTTDSVWQVQLKQDNFILDRKNFYLPVDDARVIIYQNDIALDTLENQGRGVYLSKSKSPVNYDRYEVRAETDLYGTVTAASTVPIPVPIESGILQLRNDELEITFAFEDPDNVDNFYAVSLEEEFSYTFQGEERISYSSVPITSKDPMFREEDEQLSKLIFNDRLFSGKKISLTIKPQSMRAGGKKYYLHLRTLSAELYQYETTFRLQWNIAGDPFAAPINVYSNVTNGYGIFGGYNESVFVIYR